MVDSHIRRVLVTGGTGGVGETGVRARVARDPGYEQIIASSRDRQSWTRCARDSTSRASVS